MRTALVLAGLAVAAAVAATCLLAFAELSTSTSCTASSSAAEVCTASSQTLIEDQGSTILIPLAAPIVLTTISFLLIWARTPRGLATGLAVVLLCLCVIAILSIGVFYFPAALLTLVAATRDRGPAQAATTAGNKKTAR